MLPRPPALLHVPGCLHCIPPCRFHTRVALLGVDSILGDATAWDHCTLSPKTLATLRAQEAIWRTQNHRPTAACHRAGRSVEWHLALLMGLLLTDLWLHKGCHQV